MGAWGHRPRDNDGAMDMLAVVEDAASVAAMALFAGADGCDPTEFSVGREWARLGVVEALLDARFGVDKALVKRALRHVTELIEDDERGGPMRDFFSRYRDPDEARRCARELRDRLEGMKRELPFGLARAMAKGERPEGLGEKHGR